MMTPAQRIGHGEVIIRKPAQPVLF